MNRRTTSVLALVLATGLLTCAQEATGMRHTLAPYGPANAGASVPARIIVQFKYPASTDAQAFAQRVQERTHIPAHYVAPVAGDTHVYRLQLPPGQSPAQALQQLAAMPEIARAELDAKTTAP